MGERSVEDAGAAAAADGDGDLGLLSLLLFKLGGLREAILASLSGATDEMGGPAVEAEPDTRLGRPIAAALAPGKTWRDRFEAFREGGPWKSDGGGSRDEVGESDLEFGLGFRVGDIGDVVGEICLSGTWLASGSGPESGDNAIPLKESTALFESLQEANRDCSSKKLLKGSEAVKL